MSSSRTRARRRRLPTWKLIVFTIFTVVVFFAMSEGILALFDVRPIVETEDPYVGFVSNLPLFVEHELPNGDVVMRTAMNKLNFFNPQEFPKHKAKNTYRIFCMGGSTTYGRPYNDLTSYCGWLRELLPAVDPSRHWEVINAGGISYASYREAAMMEELARYEPDLLIAYIGHNEFLERRTYSGVFEANPGVNWLGSMMGRTRTFAVTRALLRTVKPDPVEQARERYKMTGEVDALLDAMVGLDAYTRDDTLQQFVIEHYRFNLHRMARIARSAGARLVFITAASNLKDAAPFKSEHPTALDDAEIQRFDALCEHARELEENDDLDAALQTLIQAQAIDPRYAELQYRLGKVLFALHRTDEARQHFLRAREEDVVPLRQLAAMRQAKLQVAESEKVPVIDFVQIIEDSMFARFGHRIPGDEFFLDHHHPTIEGNRILATALLQELIQEDVVDARAGWRETALPLVTEKIESQVDTRMQATAMRNLARLFSWAGKTEEAGRMAKQSLELDSNETESLIVLGSKAVADGNVDLAIKYYRQALELDPNHLEARNNLAVELSRSGKHEEALEHYERLLQSNPSQPNVHINAGNACMRMGDFAEAARHFEQAIELRPGDAGSHVSLGQALAQTGRRQEAIAQFEEALQIAPGGADAHVGLATVLGQQGKEREAMQHVREAVRLDPDNAKAQQYLGMALMEKQQFSEAEPHLRAALRIAPQTPGAHYGLGMVFWSRGQVEQAMQAFDTELRLHPENVQAHDSRAFLLASQGRTQEAVDEYRDVLRLNPKDAMTCNNLAWLLATHPQAAVRNAAEAVELAERAVALTGRNHPVALNTLAAAYAEAGRFDDAIATAETAMQKARSMGQPAMAREISSLLALYRSGKPVRQEPQWLPQGRTPPQSAPETP